MSLDAIVRVLNYEQNIMEDNDPVGFLPDRVIHRVVGFDGGIFEYQNPLKAYRFDRATMNIQDFVRRLAAGNPNGDPDPDIDRLSITVNAPAYVVIELSEHLGWFFDPDYRGITLGKLDPTASRPASGMHSRLLHFNDHSQDLERRGSPNCRFAVFSTLRPLEDKPQAINFNLIDSHNTRFTIDPDIRYPGTGGEVGGGP